MHCYPRRHEPNFGYRSWHDQFLHGRPGSGRIRRHPQFRGRAHDSLDRGLHQGRRSARRPVGQAPGHHQSDQHDLCGEAPDRPPLRRPDGREGEVAGALQDREGLERRCLGRGQRPAVQPEPDLGVHSGQDEGDRRGLSRREGRAGGHHRPGLLQRRPASGHQGRRCHRGPGREAHHQRAHRRGPGLRHGQEAGRHHRRL